MRPPTKLPWPDISRIEIADWSINLSPRDRLRGEVVEVTVSEFALVHQPLLSGSTLRVEEHLEAYYECAMTGRSFRITRTGRIEKMCGVGPEPT